MLTPKGHISKYFYGIEFSARDLRLGLIEASDERIGTPVDDFLLFCYHYDPATGKYGASVLRLVRLGGILTILAFLSFLTVSLRRERQSKFAQRPADEPLGPSGGASSQVPPDGGAQSAPARERSGAWGPRERPSRGSGRSPV